MSKKRRHNIPLLLAVILLILTLLSLRLTGGLFARYRSMSASSDEARVAKFDVDSKISDDVTIDCKTGDNGTYTVTVTNNSEVAVSYEIVVKFNEAIDTDQLSVTIEGADVEISDNKTFKFTNDAWKFSPNSGEATHTLKFEVTKWDFVTGSVDPQESETFELNFKVDVTATQID